MKLPSLKLKALNNKGIAHFLAPLAVIVAVGSVGAYLVVSSQANAKVLSSASSKSPSSKPTAASKVSKGYMVLFSGGLYKKAIISVNDDGVNSTSAACDHKLFSKQPNKTVSVKVPTKIECTPNNYTVSFFKSGQSTASEKTKIAASVQTGYCSYVHAYAITRVEPLVNRSCKGSPDTKPYFRADVKLVTSVSPASVIAGSSFSITNELKYPDASDKMSVEECAGTVTIQTTSATGTTASKQGSLHFNRGLGTCIYKSTQIAKAGMPLIDRLHVKATFPGNQFVIPATSETDYSVTKQ